MDRVNKKAMRLLDRVVIGLLVLLAMLLAGLQAARAAEIVPSVGFTHGTDGGGYEPFAGLAVRGSVLPMVKAELGLAYRPYETPDLKTRTWPVTTSLWLTPIPMFYFGGGAGLYHTTYDYREGLGIQDDSSSEFGTHLGGGLSFPIVPAIASVELGGRYVHLRDKSAPFAPGAIKQSFVSTSLGVAIKF